MLSMIKSRSLRAECRWELCQCYTEKPNNDLWQNDALQYNLRECTHFRPLPLMISHAATKLRVPPWTFCSSVLFFIRCHLCHLELHHA